MTKGRNDFNYTFDSDSERSAYNLLVNCANAKSQQRVLIVAENPDLGWYDEAPVNATASFAKKIGCSVKIHRVEGPEQDLSDGLIEAIRTSNLIIFFSRIGDKNRFSENLDNKPMVMVYARKSDTFSSRFGWADYTAYVDLKDAVDSILLSEGEIKIACPLGTELSGQLSPNAKMNCHDVSILRFPLGVPQPVSAQDISGRIALAGYLTSTGSRSYYPSHLKLTDNLFAEIESGRIVGFIGSEITKKSVVNHMENIAEKFGIDPMTVHSWHAGINPDCYYADDVESHPDQWSNTVFNHPRFLHFHTCGDYAPGEICWMVENPTISVSGMNLWDNGYLIPENFTPGRECLAKWSILQEIFKSQRPDFKLVV